MQKSLPLDNPGMGLCRSEDTEQSPSAGGEGPAILRGTGLTVDDVVRWITSNPQFPILYLVGEAKDAVADFFGSEPIRQARRIRLEWHRGERKEGHFGYASGRDWYYEF